MSTPTYRRHPLNKHTPAPHLAPRSPKRRRREQRLSLTFKARMVALMAALNTPAEIEPLDHEFSREPLTEASMLVRCPTHSTIHQRAARAAFGPDPRQETRS